jgi:hypothetical protein
MIEGGLDRPGQNHLLKNIAASGSKIVFITPAVALSTVSPPDKTWTGIDLSSIIPVGATGVIVSATIHDDGTDNFLSICKKGQNSFLPLTIYVASEITYPNSGGTFIECDTNREIEYWVNQGGALSVNQCSVYIHGYTIPVVQR